MENFEFIARLEKEIKELSPDVNAEVILALAIEHGLDHEDFLVSCDSFFLREHNKEVVLTNVRDDPKAPLLECHLSRRGMYDHLPEGVFFQPEHNRRRQTDASDMARDYRINKQKEQEARRFFQPFEQEFFYQRLQIEMEEVKLLRGLHSGTLNDYFVRFWGLPVDFPPSSIIPFASLLPYASRIAGDLLLMSECLTSLLNEEVCATKQNSTSPDVAYLPDQRLGKHRLGADMILGDCYAEEETIFNFIIGPIKNTVVSDYLLQGRYYCLLQTFYQFFVPAGVRTTTSIEVSAECWSMELRQDNEPVLGYSTVLGW